MHTTFSLYNAIMWISMFSGREVLFTIYFLIYLTMLQWHCRAFGGNCSKSLEHDFSLSSEWSIKYNQSQMSPMSNIQVIFQNINVYFLLNGSVFLNCLCLLSWLGNMCSDTLSLPSTKEGQLIYLTCLNVCDLLTLKRTGMSTCLTGTRKDVGVWVIWQLLMVDLLRKRGSSWELVLAGGLVLIALEQLKLLGEGWM